ncbi:MAG: hypothetical protein CM15mP65_05280 [Crocinitomicaceae bacterium]|nr:MAG: hypothetical protein CM15mP65_05280 [Crocinitomicaceae bacterium]
MSDLQLENIGCPEVVFEVVIFADVTPFCTTTPSDCTLITPHLDFGSSQLIHFQNLNYK